MAIKIPDLNVPIEQIIKVRGRNPVAEGVSSVGDAFAKAIERRNQLSMMAQQAELVKTGLGDAGVAIPNGILDPETALGIGKVKAEMQKEVKRPQVLYDPNTKKFLSSSGVTDLQPPDTEVKIIPWQTQGGNSSRGGGGLNQDALEIKARQQIMGVRGDTQLKNTEIQRDAATSAYNRIGEIEKTGQSPNPIDYIDILGQLYKARTGSAPTNEVLSTAKQETAQGQFNKWYSYFTGKQAPATTPEITKSLKSMAASMGLQSDALHEGYIKTRLETAIPSALEKSRADKLRQLGRGTSFRDATGYNIKDAGEVTPAGFIKVIDSDNVPHVLPIKSFAAAKKRDPGLKLVK